MAKGIPVDLVGQRFGNLLVVERLTGTRSGAIWRVLCSCGKERQLVTGRLTGGEYVSCGCQRAARWKKTHAERRALWGDGNKRCPSCRTVKKLEEFNKDERGHQGIQGSCRRCCSIARLRGVYKLSKEDAAQLDALCVQGVCMICAERFDRLHVDHDHHTGRVRGTLCGNCNRALGLLRESAERATAMLRYIENAVLQDNDILGGKKL